jgi:hypothetical protein
MVYNTEANIRAGLGMGAAIPTSAAIAYWQTLIDAVIDKDRTIDATTAAVIEYNRISEIYWNLKKDKNYKIVIKPLSVEEKLLANSGAPPIDLIHMYDYESTER